MGRISSVRRLALIGLLAMAVVLSAGFTGSGGTAPRSRVAVAGGITIRLPHGWHLLRGQLSEVVIPTPRLAIASFRARLSRQECACGYPNVLRFPRGGAFLFVWEDPDSSVSAFPRRPAHFELTRATAQRFECQGPSDSFYFRISGRMFEADVYLGAGAGPDVRHQLLAALDSFRATSE
jgi:hypothetical protein